MGTRVKITRCHGNGRVTYQISCGTHSDGQHRGELKFLEPASYGRITERGVTGEKVVAVLKPDSGTPPYRLQNVPMCNKCMVDRVFSHQPNIPK